MEIKARDLLAAGWKEGPRFGAVLRRAPELEATGIDRDGTLAALEIDYPKDACVVALRSSPAALAEAVEAEAPNETVSVAAARARMLELLHVPVVKRGALMPDTCPAGVGPATIPVGELMDQLQAVTHFGAGGRPRGLQFSAAVLDEPVWDNPFLSGLQSRATEFLGTQGDGNHFAYLGRVAFTPEQQRAIERAGHDELAQAITQRDGRFHVLVTHHGSRGLGADLYKRGMLAAQKWIAGNAAAIPPAI